MCSTPWKSAPFEQEPSALRRGLTQYWREAVIGVLIVSNLVSWIQNWQGSGNMRIANSLNIDENFSKELPWNTNTLYNPAEKDDRNAIDNAWNAIIPDHGIVALDRAWAEERGLMRSMYLPSNPQKVMYVLEAYHQLHCLTTTRRAFFDLMNHRPLERDMHHYDHCFDAMLQTITCTPSTNLMFTFGHRDVNQTQKRQCRDWNALRDWATAHSACDTSDTARRNDIFHQDLCHGPTDGLVLT
ncbi:hypothetical protein FB567DRAFT_581692 [Paraphoma chrysanthemicola]|uniref:Cyclochlorotine biosynthesis protein O n=1 Tax=Paraphoma chrysanthemicola TaxID=798071 RepID=A0A8K0R0V7_9PLEO|nr:hypothetical protein FB567DRAFT_581692 [Paraphoma chrysanthemicola]